ncbi:MAG: hypothetical protein KGL95_01090, partial [Patescibacteria group bacterium]|nr:hypothetical protein [Patescibacteria group bacterium]
FNSPSQVVVQDQIACDKDTFVGPSENSGIHSHDIIIYVEGKPTINQNATSADFGKDAIVDVNMYAPTGSIEMDEGTNATGAFIADMVTVQQDSVINLDSTFGTKILINKYQGIVSELGKISDISNDAVVTDFLNKNLTSLKANTVNLVSDSQSQSTLVSILNAALQSITLASNNVLVLDKTDADTNLNNARSSLNNYVSQLNSLSGTAIPTSVANALISQANQGLTGSRETGSGVASILANNPLTDTNQLFTMATDDDTTLQGVIRSSISLGFTITLNAQHHSPTVADISFTNDATSQSFDVVIPQSTLAMFGTMGFYYQSIQDGSALTIQQIAGLIYVTPTMESSIVNSATSSSLAFVYYELCDSNFAVNDCKNGFANPNAAGSIFGVNSNFVTLQISGKFGKIIFECLVDENCQEIIQQL